MGLFLKIRKCRIILQEKVASYYRLIVTSSIPLAPPYVEIARWTTFNDKLV